MRSKMNEEDLTFPEEDELDENIDALALDD